MRRRKWLLVVGWAWGLLEATPHRGHRALASLGRVHIHLERQLGLRPARPSSPGEERWPGRRSPLRNSSLSPPAFGGKLKNPLRVVLVATHADIMNVPRPAGGEFGYDKDTSLLKEIRNR